MLDRCSIYVIISDSEHALQNFIGIIQNIFLYKISGHIAPNVALIQIIWPFKYWLFGIFWILPVDTDIFLCVRFISDKLWTGSAFVSFITLSSRNLAIDPKKTIMFYNSAYNNSAVLDQKLPVRGELSLAVQMGSKNKPQICIFSVIFRQKLECWVTNNLSWLAAKWLTLILPSVLEISSHIVT